MTMMIAIANATMLLAPPTMSATLWEQEALAVPHLIYSATTFSSWKASV